MLALAESLYQTLQILVRSVIQKRFDTFLQGFAQDFRSPGQIASEDAPLGPHLVPREQRGNHRDAHDQGQDHFQGRAHQYSSTLSRRIGHAKLGLGGLNEFEFPVRKPSWVEIFQIESLVIETSAKQFLDLAKLQSSQSLTIHTTLLPAYTASPQLAIVLSPVFTLL